MANYFLGKQSLQLSLLLIVSTFLLCLASFCQDNRQRLESNKQLWVNKKIDNYKFTLKVDCFCGAAGASPVSIEVRDSVTKSITTIATSELAEPSLFANYGTVQDLFNFIEGHLEMNLDSFKVVYDTNFGYPKIIEIDKKRSTADDEIVIEVSNFEILK